MEQENKTEEMTNNKKAKSNKSDKKFSKEQLLKSKAYHLHRDLLNALLADGEAYSKKEADKLINDYKNKAVK